LIIAKSPKDNSQSLCPRICDLPDSFLTGRFFPEVSSLKAPRAIGFLRLKIYFLREIFWDPRSLPGNPFRLFWAFWNREKRILAKGKIGGRAWEDPP